MPVSEYVENEECTSLHGPIPRDGDASYVVRYYIEPGFGVECSQLSEFVKR